MAVAALRPRRRRGGSSAGGEEYNDCRARLGLPPLPGVHTGMSRALTLVGTLPQLEYPRDWAPWLRVVGALLWEPPGERVAPPPGDGPVVMVAPSTAQDPEHALLRAALAGLAAAPVRVVATYNGRDPGAIDVPANAVLVPWLSYARSMPACDAVVMHGGHGTLVRALSCGCVPVVCPAGGDMAENAARAAWAGLGVRLPRRLLARARSGSPSSGALGDGGDAARVRPPRHGCDATTARHEPRVSWRRGRVRPRDDPVSDRPHCSRPLPARRSPDAARTRRTPAQAARPRAERRSRARRSIDPASMKGAKGEITFCAGKDTTGAKTAGVKAFNAANPDAEGDAARVPGVRRRAAQPVRPAPGGEVRRVRRLLLRRRLDGGVRPAEVALRHDAVRQEPRRTSSSSRRSTRRPTRARPGASRTRRTPASSTTGPTRSTRRRRPGRRSTRQAAEYRRPRLPGRGLRGPDLQLPRDRLRRRAARCCPRTASSPSSTRPRTSRRSSSWSTGSRTARRPRP